MLWRMCYLVNGLCLPQVGWVEEPAWAGCNISLTLLCSFTMYNINYTCDSAPPTERVEAYFNRPSVQKWFMRPTRPFRYVTRLSNMNSAENRFSLQPTPSCLPSWKRVFLSTSTQLIMTSSSIILGQSLWFRIWPGKNPNWIFKMRLTISS